MNETTSNFELDRALELKRLKKWDQAYATFERALENCREEQQHFCLSNMAHIQYLKGNYPQAQHLAEEALRHHSQNWFALGILGEIAYKKRQYETALASFEEAHQLNPTDIYLLKRLVKVLQLSNQTERALNLVKTAILAQPNESELFLCLGDLLRAKGEVELARENYLKAIQLNQNNQYAFRQWIATLEQEKSKEEILTEIEKLMKLPSQKGNPFLQDYYSKLLRDLGRLNESTSQLESAIQTDPRSVYRKTRLAANYNRQKKYQQAIHLLEPDYKNGVVDIYLFQELACAYLGLEQKAFAQKVLVRGLKQFPGSTKLRTLLMKAR